MNILKMCVTVAPFLLTGCMGGDEQAEALVSEQQPLSFEKQMELRAQGMAISLMDELDKKMKKEME